MSRHMPDNPYTSVTFFTRLVAWTAVGFAGVAIFSAAPPETPLAAAGGVLCGFGIASQLATGLMYPVGPGLWTRATVAVVLTTRLRRRRRLRRWALRRDFEAYAADVAIGTECPLLWLELMGYVLCRWAEDRPDA